MTMTDGLRRAAEIAREYSAPDRFKVSDTWRDEYSPSQVYNTGAVDVAIWIAKACEEEALLAVVPQPLPADRAAMVAELDRVADNLRDDLMAIPSLDDPSCSIIQCHLDLYTAMAQALRKSGGEFARGLEAAAEIAKVNLLASGFTEATDYVPRTIRALVPNAPAGTDAPESTTADASASEFQSVNKKLIADLERLTGGSLGCDRCGAPLFDDDDFVRDPDGIRGCWASMTDRPSKTPRPCWAYRVGKPRAPGSAP